MNFLLPSVEDPACHDDYAPDRSFCSSAVAPSTGNSPCGSSSHRLVERSVLYRRDAARKRFSQRISRRMVGRTRQRDLDTGVAAGNSLAVFAERHRHRPRAGVFPPRRGSPGSRSAANAHHPADRHGGDAVVGGTVASLSVCQRRALPPGSSFAAGVSEVSTGGGTGGRSGAVCASRAVSPRSLVGRCAICVRGCRAPGLRQISAFPAPGVAGPPTAGGTAACSRRRLSTTDKGDEH